MQEEDNMKALAFGEIIWDTYEDGETLGGAPLNVAGHISRLGGSVSVISAVGSDEIGKRTISTLNDMGVDTSFIHRSSYPTGRAFVKLQSGIPSYSFNEPAAWDDIKLSENDAQRIRKESWDVFIFGSLAQRAETSRTTLMDVLSTISAKELFFDVNLRLSFYSKEVLETSLSLCSIVKMNDEEIGIVSSMLKADGIRDIMKRYSIPLAITTYGKNGTRIHKEGNDDILIPAGSVNVVDTVGAGDSLSAAFLFFYSQRGNAEEAGRKASLLADYVVSKKGAIPQYTEEIREKLFS